MAHGDFKDLPRRIASKKVLSDKAFNTAKKQKRKCDGYQRGLTSMAQKFLDKRPSATGVKIEIMSDQELAVIERFKKLKVYSSFEYNIWGTGYADMQLMNKFNKGFQFLLLIFFY